MESAGQQRDRSAQGWAGPLASALCIQDAVTGEAGSDRNEGVQERQYRALAPTKGYWPAPDTDCAEEGRDLSSPFTPLKTQNMAHVSQGEACAMDAACLTEPVPLRLEQPKCNLNRLIRTANRPGVLPDVTLSLRAWAGRTLA